MKYEGIMQYGTIPVPDDIEEYIIERYNKNVKPEKIYEILVKTKTAYKFLQKLSDNIFESKRKIVKYSVPVEIALLLTGKKPNQLSGEIDYEPFTVFPTNMTIYAREMLLGILVPFGTLVPWIRHRIDDLIKSVQKKLEFILKFSRYDISFNFSKTKNLLKISYEIGGEKQFPQKRKFLPQLITSFKK